MTFAIIKLNDSQKIRLLSSKIFIKRFETLTITIFCDPQVYQQEPGAASDWPQVRRLLHEPCGGDEEDQQFGHHDPGHGDEPLLHPPR